MKILDYNDLKNFKQNTLVTIGFFDGIHLAHQKILKTLIEKSKKLDCQSVVITFDENSLKLLKKSHPLMSLKDKIKVFRQLKIDYLIILKKDDNFIDLKPQEFINKYLQPINTKGLVLGSDFTFARFGLANINYLKNNTNYHIYEIKDVYYKKQKVSSSYIRNLLLNGQIKLVNKLLIKPFSLTSFVIKGLQNGSKIGFKTANLKIYDSCYLLKHGVYFGKAIIKNKTYDAMINVGFNPTIKDNNNLKIEAHLLNLNENLYHHKITLIFNYYEREERKFNSLSSLKRQLSKDLKKLQKYIEKA